MSLNLFIPIITHKFYFLCLSSKVKKRLSSSSESEFEDELPPDGEHPLKKSPKRGTKQDREADRDL